MSRPPLLAEDVPGPLAHILPAGPRAGHLTPPQRPLHQQLPDAVEARVPLLCRLQPLLLLEPRQETVYNDGPPQAG